MGGASKKLKNCIEELGVVISTILLQETALLGTARILRKVLDCGKGLWRQGWGRGKKRGEVGGRRERVPKIEQVGKNVKI